MRRRPVCGWWLGLVLLGCAPSASRLPAAMPLPQPRAEREAVVHGFGRWLFGELSRGTPERLLFDDEVLRAVLEPAAAVRAASLRHNLAGSVGAELAGGGLFRGTRYLGLCVQRARNEAPGGMLGLRRAGWVFERALVVAEEPGGGRVAAWAEGVFVHTDRGPGAVDLSRVEAPRRDHADLELASCDLAAGPWSPHSLVEGDALDH